jgi:hypothetical protein
MTIEILKSPSQVDAQRLKKLERDIAALLPTDYREFLLATNGGFSHEYEFEFYSTSFGPQTEAVFLWASIDASFKLGHFMNMEKVMTNLKNILPPGTIPIASSEGGHGLILLSVNKNDYGSIFHYDDEAAPQKAVTKLAFSFTDFVEMLKLSRRRS